MNNFVGGAVAIVFTNIIYLNLYILFVFYLLPLCYCALLSLDLRRLLIAKLSHLRLGVKLLGSASILFSGTACLLSYDDWLLLSASHIWRTIGIHALEGGVGRQGVVA